MVLMGGRGNNSNESLSLDVYDTENSEWYRYPSVQRFRHASWLSEGFLYCYAGFELDQPNVPTETIHKVNLMRLFENDENLSRKL